MNSPVGEKGVKPARRARSAARKDVLILHLSAPTLLLLALIFYVSRHDAHQIGLGVQAALATTAKHAVPLALAAIGAGLVISLGGVDLSSMGNATLSGVLAAAALTHYQSHLIAVSVGLSCGAIVGLIVGELVVRGVAPLVASWAIGTLAFVIAMATSANGWLGLARDAVGADFRRQGSWMDLWSADGHGQGGSYILITVVLLLIGASTLPSRTRAIGANRESAVLAGIRTRLVTRVTFLVAGLLSASYGILQATMFGRASTTSMVGRELVPIAVAVLGGTLLSGGYYSAFSIAAAAGLWTMIFGITNSLDLAGFNGSNQQRFVDAAFSVIVLAISWLVGALLRRDLSSALVENRVEES